MNVSYFNHVRFAALGVVVPSEEIALRNELQYYNDSPEQVQRITDLSGFERRRIAPEGVTAADLCVQAAERILSESGVAREEIDAVLFISESPDYPVPATAALLQTRLGLARHCAAFDMTAACTGYIHALWVASGLIESGACRQVLICAGNATARFYNPANRIIAPLFGDAGSATLCARTEQETLLSFSLGNDGTGAELFMVPGGGARIPPVPQDGPDSPFNRSVSDASGNPWTLGGYAQCWMNGMDLFRAVVSTVPGHIQAHLDNARCSVNTLDALVLHQGNRLMVETIAKKVGIPAAKSPWSTLARYGNQMCASLPSVLCDQFVERLAMPQPLRVMLCGYGAGFSWGSCLLETSGVKCCGVQNYIPTEPMLDRDQRIAYWHQIFQGKQV